MCTINQCVDVTNSQFLPACCCLLLSPSSNRIHFSYTSSHCQQTPKKGQYTKYKSPNSHSTGASSINLRKFALISIHTYIERMWFGKKVKYFQSPGSDRCICSKQKTLLCSPASSCSESLSILPGPHTCGVFLHIYTKYIHQTWPTTN